MCHLKQDLTYPFVYLACSLAYPARLLKTRMSSKPSELEKSVEEVLKKIMNKGSISEGVQASLTRGLQDSPSIGHRSSHVNPRTEQQSNHCGGLANAKQILSILPEYIPPLVGVVNRDNIS
jgi:hypothetical protein